MKKLLFTILALTPAVAFGASMSSYPSKTTPASADKVPISDSAASNATKNITVGSIWDNIPGTSLSATAPLSLNQSTGELSIDLSAYILKTAIDTQAEFEALLFALPTGGAGGYVATPPTYSDEACTAGQYALSESYRYDCVSSGNWNRTALTDWSNPTPSSDGTPNAFTFTDVTNATVSTQYTALAQITGIDVGITCSASGGTVAACTGATEGTCGTFGATSGSLTNNQYVGARVTSSGNNSTAVNNAVTCGGVIDTFTVTTAAAPSSSCMSGTYIFAWNGDFTADTDRACSSSADTTGIDGILTGSGISTTYGEGGSYGMIIDSANDYITYSTSADANFDPSVAQTIWMRVYVSGNVGQLTPIVKICGSADCSGANYVQVAVNSGAINLLCTYRNATIAAENYSTGSVSAGVWTDMAYTFDPANQDHDITVNGGSSWSEDLNELTTTSTWDAVRIVIGNQSSSSPSPSYVYVDKVAIVSGYKAAKPSGW